MSWTQYTWQGEIERQIFSEENNDEDSWTAKKKGNYKLGHVITQYPCMISFKNFGREAFAKNFVQHKHKEIPHRSKLDPSLQLR